MKRKCGLESQGTKNEIASEHNREIASVSTGRLWYRWLLFIAAICAVSYFAYRSIRQLAQYTLEIDAIYLVLAFLSTLCAYLVLFIIWTRLTAVFSLEAPAPIAGRAYFLSYLARYIPGKVGLILARIEAYTGHSPPRVIMATALEQVATLTSALILVLVGIAFSPSLFPSQARFIALIGVVPLFIILTPPVLSSVTGAACRLFKKKEIEISTTFKTNFAFVGLYMIPSLFHGLSLFLVLNALAHVPAEHLLSITGIYIAAIIVGLFAIFVPGGIGIREGTLFLVLPSLVTSETAVISAVIMRLMTIACELLLAGIFVFMARAHRNRING